MLMTPEGFLQEMNQQVNRVMVPFLNNPDMESEKQAEKNLKVLMKGLRDSAKQERYEKIYLEQGLPAVAEIIARETELIWRNQVEADYRNAGGVITGKEAYRQYLSRCEGCCRMLEYAADLYPDKYDTARVPVYRVMQQIVRFCMDSKGYEIKKPLLGKETRNEIPIPETIRKSMQKRMELCEKQQDAIQKHNTGLSGMLHSAIRGGATGKAKK